MRSAAQPYWGDDMSVWVTPRTWTSTVVTAADMNAETRDHLLWLKGFADLITAASAADTGSATYLKILRGASSLTAYASGAAADTFNRFQVTAAGKMTWGSGTATGDVTIERLAANRLGVKSGVFEIEREGLIYDALVTRLVGDADNRFTLEIDGAMTWGDGVNGRDTKLYRLGPSRLGLPDGDSFQLVSGSLGWGPVGAQTSFIYELNPGRMYTPQTFSAADGLTTKARAGAISDGNFSVAPVSGTMAVDTTNNRFYVRSGSTWRYVQLV